MAGEKIFRLLFKKNIFGNWESKPFWEKIRVGLQYISLLLAISLLFDVGITTSIHCVPSNSTIKLTTPETDKANADCAAKLLHSLKYFLFENLLIILSVFAIDVMWAGIPRIQQTFKTLKECDRKLQSLESVLDTRKVVRRMVEEEEQIDPVPTDVDLRRLKDICKDLWSLNPGFPKCLSISALYTLRNIISCVLIRVSLKVLYSVSTEDSQRCYLESEVATELYCTFSFHAFGKSVLQGLIIVQWIFASFTASKIFAVLPRLKDSKTFVLRLTAIVIGFHFGLYQLYVHLGVHPDNVIRVPLALSLWFYACFVLYSGLAITTMFDEMMMSMLCCLLFFVEVPFPIEDETFDTSRWRGIYWDAIFAIVVIVLATGLLRCDTPESLMMEVDNELASSFLQHSNNPLSPRTVDILIPTKIAEKDFVVEFLKR